MLELFILGWFCIFFTFLLSNFQFLSLLIVVENLNILVLLNCLISDTHGNNLLYLVFMVVVTIEIMLALVVLTRLWNLQSLNS